MWFSRERRYPAHVVVRCGVVAGTAGMLGALLLAVSAAPAGAAVTPWLVALQDNNNQIFL
jgi:hypothetical protein